MTINRVQETTVVAQGGQQTSLYRRLRALFKSTRPGRPMVGWYNPKQLMHTGIEVLISTIIGRHADRRLVEALASNLAEVYDFSGTSTLPDLPAQTPKLFKTSGYSVTQQICAIPELPERPDSPLIWIDYVSDLGDGWNSTYAIAQALGKERLEVTLPEGGAAVLPRGNILIFGGDEVYPTAERKEYQERLEFPYLHAIQKQEATPPYIFAIPGNHDWYDSLSAFSNVFCDQFTSHFAGKRWMTPQNRSYFALRLPKGWWLFGIDIQLKTDLDELQLRYFDHIVKHQMTKGDRVILCCSEPFWVYNKMYAKIEEQYKASNVSRLEREILQDMHIVLYLAGDLHHYFRVLDRDQNTLKVTSGGGGAFLHPTHGVVARSFANPPMNFAQNTHERYHVKMYPNRKTSWWLGCRNLLFPFLNPSFGLITGTLYLLVSWFLLVGLDDSYLRELKQSTSVFEVLRATSEATVYSPFLSFLLMAILGGFILFTEPDSRYFRRIAGILHGVTHIMASFLVAWVGLRLYLSLEMSHGRGVLAALAIFILGWCVGSILMGIYLFISLMFLGGTRRKLFLRWPCRTGKTSCDFASIGKPDS